jgi:hypothetical protein
VPGARVSMYRIRFNSLLSRGAEGAARFEGNLMMTQNGATMGG